MNDRWILLVAAVIAACFILQNPPVHGGAKAYVLEFIGWFVGSMVFILLAYCFALWIGLIH